MPDRPQEPAHPLPLTDLAFNILLALKDEELHGYALVKRLRVLDGRASLRTGTVYAALARLEDDGLVVDADHAFSEGEDVRRRYYKVTDHGLGVARAEAERLSKVLRIARSKNMLADPATG